MPAQGGGARIGFLTQTAELLNHYANVLARMPEGSFEVVAHGSPAHRRGVAQIATAAGWPCVTSEERLSHGLRYRYLVSNHPIDTLGVPLIQRLGEFNVRFMYAIGKAAWNFAPWNSLYDAILCYGPYHVEGLAPVTDAIRIPMGYPRFDHFFELDAAKPRLQADLGCDPDKPTVLWLPTWSTLTSVGHFDTDVARLCADCNVVVKVHPLMPEAQPELVAGLRSLPLACLVTDATDNVPLFAAADFVLADYGGSAFGAIYADRNVVLLDVPGAESDDALGPGSAEFVIREVMPRAQADRHFDLAGLLGDTALWQAQRRVRAELRAAFFAPYYGFAATVAAEVLTHLDTVIAHGKPAW